MSTATTPSLGQSIYNDSASFGRITSYISLYIGGFIAILLIALGIYLLVKKPAPSKLSAKGIISDVSCTLNTSKSPQQYNCNMKITYTPQNQKPILVNLSTTGTTNYVNGQTVDVYYSLDDTQSVSLTSSNTLSPRWIGAICIVIAVLLIAFGYYQYWITKNYKFAAAGTGVADVYNMFT